MSYTSHVMCNAISATCLMQLSHHIFTLSLSYEWSKQLENALASLDVKPHCSHSVIFNTHGSQAS
jgi:hypothetical protein